MEMSGILHSQNRSGEFLDDKSLPGFEPPNRPARGPVCMPPMPSLDRQGNLRDIKLKYSMNNGKLTLSSVHKSDDF